MGYAIPCTVWEILGASASRSRRLRVRLAGFDEGSTVSGGRNAGLDLAIRSAGLSKRIGALSPGPSL